MKKRKDEIGIIDIETTGWQKAGGKIVEVGIVSVNLRTGEIKTIFDEVTHEKPYTKKDKPLTKAYVDSCWIVNNSTLTTEMIQKSRQLIWMKPKIQEIINSFELGMTAYNIKFDRDYMESRGFVFPVLLDCLMEVSKHICKIPAKNLKYGKYKNPKAEEAIRIICKDENFIEDHRGASDAYHEGRVALELFKMGKLKVKKYV